MRTRPFRFFFGLSIAVIFFFFLAKVFFFAFIAAGIMSLMYHLFRGIKYSLMDLGWDGRRRGDYRRFQYEHPQFDPMVDRHTFFEQNHRGPYQRQKERIIEIF